LKYFYQKRKIDFPKNGRRFAISDIHGCYLTFKTIVENRLELTHDDQLFLLGDYINKGPKSKKTLNYIIELISHGYRIYPLRGNHEQDIIDAVKKEPEALKWLLRKSPDMIKNGSVRRQHLLFLDSLPFYYVLPDFYLVHGGFNFKAKDPFKDKKAMIWRRMPEKSSPFLDNKVILHGHRSCGLDEIRKMVDTRSTIIGLDNGVNYNKDNKMVDYSQMGNLCALNLDSFELIFQPNVELMDLKQFQKQKKIA